MKFIKKKEADTNAARVLPPYHSYDIKRVETELKTSIFSGLTYEEVEARRETYGYNDIVEQERRRAIILFFRQFYNIPTLVLAIASVITIIISDWAAVGTLILVIVFNSIISFYQENQAEITMSSLRKVSSSTATVIRNAGLISTVPSRDLVPGDIIILSDGDKIPADCRIIEDLNFEVDESTLSGESLSVCKTRFLVEGTNVPLHERINMIYMGTTVTNGRCRALVVATGADTEVGVINTSVQSESGKEVKTPLEIQLSKLYVFLLMFAVFLMLLVFAVSKFKITANVSLYAVSLGIAIIPESLVAVVTLTLSRCMKKMSEYRAIVRNFPTMIFIGAATDICTDKTGTITQGKMTLSSIIVSDEVERSVRRPDLKEGAKFLELDGSEVDLSTCSPSFKKLVECAAICNNATINKLCKPVSTFKRLNHDHTRPKKSKKFWSHHLHFITKYFRKKSSQHRRKCPVPTTPVVTDGDWVASGSPTEIALLGFLSVIGVSKVSLTDPVTGKYIVEVEYPFDSTVKTMSVLARQLSDYELKFNSNSETESTISRVHKKVFSNFALPPPIPGASPTSNDVPNNQPDVQKYVKNTSNVHVRLNLNSAEEPISLSRSASPKIPDNPNTTQSPGGNNNSDLQPPSDGQNTNSQLPSDDQTTNSQPPADGQNTNSQPSADTQNANSQPPADVQNVSTSPQSNINVQNPHNLTPNATSSKPSSQSPPHATNPSSSSLYDCEENKLPELVVFSKGSVEVILNNCTGRWDSKSQSFLNFQDIEDKKKTTEEISSQVSMMASRGLRIIAFSFKKLPPVLVKECVDKRIKAMASDARFRRRKEAEKMESSTDEISYKDLYQGITSESVFKDVSRSSIECDMMFLGLVGMYDPPRLESAGAVRECHRAGIAVRMLTGDHPITAESIARQVGILGAEHLVGYDKEHVSVNDRVVWIGLDFDALTDRQVDTLPHLPLVISRCTPGTKLKLVNAIKRRGGVVVMTGDGVNDSPSLKGAHVGIAMGIAGSDVAKEASDMILTDDNFVTIVTAVAQGRRVFANLIKFVSHLMITNAAEIIALVFGLLIVDPQGSSVYPISPLQLLFMNMITSSPPALALGVEPPRKYQMISSRCRGGNIFKKENIIDMLFYGTILGLITLGSFIYVIKEMPGTVSIGSGCNSYYHSVIEIDGIKYGECDTVYRARSTAFITLVYLTLYQSFVCRNRLQSTWHWHNTQKANYSLIICAIFGSIIVFPTVYIPSIAGYLFRCKAISSEWVVVLVAIILYIIVSEIYKFALRVIESRQGFSRIDTTVEFFLEGSG